MVDLLFLEDDALLRQQGVVRTLYDPAAETGGMLFVAEEYLRELNTAARLQVFGQGLNDEAFAICQSDMMLKGANPANIVSGNSFSRDGFAGRRYDYFLSNPPYGVEWKKVGARSAASTGASATTTASAPSSQPPISRCSTRSGRRWSPTRTSPSRRR